MEPENKEGAYKVNEGHAGFENAGSTLVPVLLARVNKLFAVQSPLQPCAFEGPYLCISSQSSKSHLPTSMLTLLVNLRLLILL